MAMMTGDRPVVISVIGASSTSHQANYTVKVPYSSMARTIQVITKQGGKITNVTVGTTASSPAPTVAPSEVPMAAPSEVPMVAPSEVPMAAPSEVPTVAPSEVPTTTIKPIKKSNKGFKPRKK